MRLHLIALAAALVVTGFVAGYLFIARAVEPAPLPAELIAAEEALGLPETVGLLHFNVSHAVEVEDLILGEADRDALTAPLTEDETMGRLLAAAGVDIRQDIHQLLAAMILGETGPTGVAIVLGRFDVDALAAALPEIYQVEPVDLAGSPGVLLVKEDLMTCQLSTPIALHMAADRLVMGSEDEVGKVLTRLASGDQAAIDLTAWRAEREGNVLSLALLRSPTELAAKASHPMIQMGAQAGAEDLGEIERIFAGAAFQAVPPRLLVETRVISASPVWADSMVARYAAWTEEISGGIGQDLPTLTKLMGQLRLAADGPELVTEVAFDEAFLQETAQLPGEVMGLIFSGMGVSSADSGSGQAAPAEQTVPPEEVAVYLQQTSHGALKPFDPALDNAFGGAEGVGPFALKIDAFRISDSNQGEVVELEIDAISGELPNMIIESMHSSADNARARLAITEVLDAQGVNLLREERCGADRNTLPGALDATTRYSFEGDASRQVPIVAGSKTIRLRPGAGVNDIVGIHGQISLRLPTQTESVVVEAPFDQKVVGRPGVRIKLDAGAPGQVSYEVSGDIDRVLAVRALNASGQMLRGMGSFGSGRVFGSGSSVSKSFAGEPAAVEFVIATEDMTQDYPFQITQVAPIFSTWDWPEAYEVTTASLEAFNQDRDAIDFSAACDGQPSDPQLAPFHICVGSVRAQWGTFQGQFEVLAPDSPGLMGNLSGLELLVQSANPQDGDEVALDLGRFLALRKAFDADHLEDTPWLSGEAPETLADQSITALGGTLIVRLPLKLGALSMDVRELGQEVSAPDGLKVRLVGFENGGLVLDVTGPRERLVQFVPRDGAGVALATNGVRVEEGDSPGRWRAWLSVSGRPDGLDIIFAETQERIDYPFDLNAAPQ